MLSTFYNKIVSPKMLLWRIIFNTERFMALSRVFGEKTPPSDTPRFLEDSWDGIEFCCILFTAEVRAANTGPDLIL
jgi:hypothetical protein